MDITTEEPPEIVGQQGSALVLRAVIGGRLVIGMDLWQVRGVGWTWSAGRGFLGERGGSDLFGPRAGERGGGGGEGGLRWSAGRGCLGGRGALVRCMDLGQVRGGGVKMECR